MDQKMNKPVAWAYIKDGEFWDAVHPDEHDRYEGMYTTPLYTHPVKENCCPDCGCHFTGEYPFNYTVKELTDEEIKEVWFKLEHELGSHIMHGFAFARAILRKAQEK